MDKIGQVVQSAVRKYTCLCLSVKWTSVLVWSFMVVMFLPSFALAQTTWHVGVHGGWLRSWHETAQDVRVLEGGCGQFTSAHGNGFSAGLAGEVDLLPWLRGTARLSYAKLGATFKTICDNGIIVPTGSDNEFAPLVREYSKDVRLDYGLLELGVKFMPLDLPLFLTTGVSVGAPIFRSDWTQDERIISPAGALFPGFTARRSNGGADFTDTQLRTAITAGIGYAIALRGNVELSPEITYAHPLADATTGFEWKIAYMTAGTSLTWSFTFEEEAPPPVAPAPPPPPTPQPPVAHIGTTTDASIDITETFVTETFPLLPYVFFEKNSSTMPEKYRTMREENTAAFTEAGLPRKTLPIYYHFLDIMGKRLRGDPSIRITLVGSTDDKDAEQGNTTLALARANAVRQYFVDVWEIEGARIGVSTQKLPQMPSSVVFPEGDEENRRVEILSDADDIFRPVVHERLSEFEISPPTLEIALGADASSLLSSWSMNIRRDAEIVAQFGSAGAPPPTVRWLLVDALAALVHSEDTLTATLTVTDENGLSASSDLVIPVHKKQNSFEVGRLSLIVFDFDRSDILPHNQRMIKRFVSEAIMATSSVTITGSTDRLGEEKHNIELSAARAENVKELLLSQKSRYEKLEARGIGESPDLYDNSLPEGRFYCRTVSVEVKTPVEMK
ncbi:MAG: OmpA family protein [Bacteroidota bacterium]|jgi:outer membrane protein OmpA-like peptidoglycan-associated protein